MWRDYKYLLAFILPAVGVLMFVFQGLWSFSGVIVSFMAIPLLEIVFTGTEENLTQEEEPRQNQKWIFDWILYLNVPIILGLVVGYFYMVFFVELQVYEVVGMTMSIGMYIGGVGINVAHELGHREKRHEQILAHLLLIPNLYLHFFVEHNRGHHVNIATDRDPASARYGESIYRFYLRSVILGYLSAWKLENKRLRSAGKAVFSRHNSMIWYLLIQLAYLGAIGWFLGPLYMGLAVVVGIFGFLMLETVNYIEHYGLRRRLLPSGKYERVQPWHCWNCNHEIGRILLYELTRHSDHHCKSTRKYQILRHVDNTPMLPYGYPACMVLALFPPIWFRIMNPRVKAVNENLPPLPTVGLSGHRTS